MRGSFSYSSELNLSNIKRFRFGWFKEYSEVGLEPTFECMSLKSERKTFESVEYLGLSEFGDERGVSLGGKGGGTNSESEALVSLRDFVVESTGVEASSILAFEFLLENEGIRLNFDFESLRESENFCRNDVCVSSNGEIGRSESTDESRTEVIAGV